MARIKGTAPSQMVGSVGMYTYRMTKDGIVVSEKIQAKGVTKRTLRQAEVRMQFANIFHLFKAFGTALDGAFENKPANQNDLNAFVKANYGIMPVYLTKQASENGACVVAPYQISRGSLPAIQVVTSGSVPRTHLVIGITIDANTTMAAFSEAVINNNYGFANGDQLTYFSIIQGTRTYGTLTVPEVTVNKYEVTLDKYDTTHKLWDLVGKYGFSTVSEGTVKYLGLSAAPAIGGYAYVHSRGVGAELRVSTQHIITNNQTVLSANTGSAALENAALSYGGYQEARFLEPGATTSNVVVSGGEDQTTGAVASGTWSIDGVTNDASSSSIQRVNLGAGAVTMTINGTNMSSYNSAVKLKMYANSYESTGTEVTLTKDSATSTSSAAVYKGTITSEKPWLGNVMIDGQYVKNLSTYGGNTGGGDVIGG